MNEICLIRLKDRCDYPEYVTELKFQSDWDQLTDEELEDLRGVVKLFNQKNGHELYIVEKLNLLKDYPKIQNSVKAFVEEQKLLREQEKLKEAARKSLAAEKSLERKKKQLEKLTKELGVKVEVS